MIRIDDIRKTFGDRLVLNCPSICFELACVHGIVGLNGAGKTTLFNILSGYLRPDSGVVMIDREALGRKDVAYLETENFFYSLITGEEYLSIFPSSNVGFQVERMNELLHLPLNELIETYSTGMKKKLALLAVLKQDKPIYLLDEPFSGLDLEASQVLKLVIQRLQRKGKTIFLSSHILSPLITLCDRIHLLHGGVFTRAYDRNEFNTIEPDLFAGFDVKVRQVLDASL